MFTDKNGKKWFKGNLHMHTTKSDGTLSPEDALALYKSHGYDFVSVTDHWIYTPDGDYDGMLVIGGIECNIGSHSARDGVYHVLAVGCTRAPDATRRDDVQTIIDAVHAAGGLACIAHPAWSLNSPESIMQFSGWDFTEIFNSVSDLPRNARPYSGLILDMLAMRGVYLPLAATDDAHFYQNDAVRSYIMVEAEECTRDAIMASLRGGRYYSSQGPVIDVKYDGEKVTVECSPVNEIIYFTGSTWTSHRADVGPGLTHGEYIPTPTDGFVRVEVRDADGKYAWGQYIKTEK